MRIVDHHDLAVVAHVDAALERAREQEADRERHGDPHARLGHALPVLGADHGAGAEVVGHGAAGDAAGGGALQRLDHLEAVGVGEPDVEADVDMALGGVDVGDHVVDHVVAVAEELALVAADGGEAGDRLADAEERQVVGRHARRLVLALVAADLGEGGQPRHGALEAGDAAAADVGLAEEHVGEHADDGRDDDDDHPGEARRRLAVRAEERAADEEDLQRHVDGEQEPAREVAEAPEPAGAVHRRDRAARVRPSSPWWR